MKKLFISVLLLISFSSQSAIIGAVQGDNVIGDMIIDLDSEIGSLYKLYTTTSLPTLIVQDSEVNLEQYSAEELEILLVIAMEEEDDGVVEIIAEEIELRE